MSDPDEPRGLAGRAGPETAPARIIAWVTVAVLAWGVFHAVGAWRFNDDPRRAVVVLACVAAFLGFWMTMLAVRQRRLSRRR